MSVNLTPSRSPSGSPAFSPANRPVYRGGAVAGGAPAWSPAEISNIVDYGVWDDTSRLFQNSNGTGAVASAGDPVGYWKGQLDVLTLTAANAANKPQYAADGIYFLASGTERFLGGAITATATSAALACAASKIDGPGSDRHMQFGFSLNTSYNGTQVHARYAYNTLLSRITSTTVAALNTTAQSEVIWTFNGTVASAFVDGVKTNLSVGTYNGTLNYFFLRTPTTGDPKCRKWAVFSGNVSDADAALLTTWLEG